MVAQYRGFLSPPNLKSFEEKNDVGTKLGEVLQLG
jgi:hypothetical protein